MTSFTATRLLSSETHQDLRDALICICSELTPTRGPLAVVRVDAAPGFQALREDEILRKSHLQIDIGRIKNPNHNPVADKAIQELEGELRRQLPRGEPLTSRTLAVTTAILNSRIRSNGLSSREMLFQRDQITNDQLPVEDHKRIIWALEVPTDREAPRGTLLQLTRVRAKWVVNTMKLGGLWFIS